MKPLDIFIAAPSLTIARNIELRLREEFKFDRVPKYILSEQDFVQMAGIEKCNLFVATSGREFLSMHAWPVLVKRLRLEWELRCTGPNGMFSKWIEVYLP